MKKKKLRESWEISRDAKERYNCVPEWGWHGDDHIVILWNIEDVKHQAECMKIKLNKDECREVLDACLEGHDASIGISWDILEHHIWNLFKHKKKAA